MSESPEQSPKQAPAERSDFKKNGRAERFKILQRRSRTRVVPTQEDRDKHLRFITRLKWTLSGLALFFTIAILVWPSISHYFHRHNHVLRHLAHRLQETGDMDHAVYRGVDGDGRVYMITASKARQVDDKRIELNAPEADLHLSDGTWLYGRADHGTYMQNTHMLFLDGHVRLYRSDGTLVNGLNAQMDLKQAIIATPDWVHAEGPLGIQDAQSMFMDQKRGILQFQGPGVTVRYPPKKNKSPDTKQDAKNAAVTPAKKLS